MKSKSQDSWVLYSERALDTLCICGLRGRLSRGELDAQYRYQAVDDLEVVLDRPVFEGVVESITQGDLDILRAAVTHYIFEYGYDTQKAGEDLLDRESDELYIFVTPDDIRRILLATKDDLPTRQITRSLSKLSTLKAQANYRLRVKNGSEPTAIQGTLFSLHTAPAKTGSRRVGEYALWFETDWGRLFIHNVRCGNFTIIRDIPYPELDNAEKSLFFPIMAMKNALFIRKQAKLLHLIHNGDNQNLPRAINRLESNLTALEEYGLLRWTMEKDNYRIHRVYDPTKGRLSGSPIEVEGKVEQEALDKSVVSTTKNTTESNNIAQEIMQLLNEEEPNEWDCIRCNIVEGVAQMHKELKNLDPSLRQKIKPALLRRNYKQYPPHYLWTQEEFRLQKEVVEQAIKYGAAGIKEAFKQIEDNPQLQQDLKEWTAKVESLYVGGKT